MKEKLFKEKKCNENLSSIGSGIIEIEDFNTSVPNKKRITNQLKTIEEYHQQKIQKKYKYMSLEELRKMRIISNTNGRPSSSLTDEKWQTEFAIRKLFITPYANGKSKKISGKYSQEYVKRNKENLYDGCTGWQSYSAYINDILKNIRAGQIDYCYYIYQITDLLKFHFNDLRTKYCDGYWMVWLENKEND